MYQYRWAAGNDTMEAAHFLHLLDEMRRSFDPAELDRLAAEAQQILADQMAAIPLLRLPMVSAFLPDAVAGYVPHPSRANALWSVEQWHRPTDATSGG